MGYQTTQLDVNNDFLNKELEEKVYMYQPKGFEDKYSSDYFCKLNKALYGLKQDLRAWFQKLFSTFTTLGFEHSKANNSTFFQRYGTYIAIVLIYVNGIIRIGIDNAYLKLLTVLLGNSFVLKELGKLSFFLGMEIQRTNGFLYMNQHKYITDLLLKYGLDSTKPVSTSTTSSAPFSKFDGTILANGTHYR